MVKTKPTADIPEELVPIPMTGVLVVIASPGDAVEERAAVRDGHVDWNISRGAP
jgi:hypothetical protein